MFTSKILVPVMLLCSSLILYGTASVSATSEPLLLTPYIQQGNITAARQLSRVDDSEGIIPTSYAGFITVDSVVRNHLFFWFFPVMNYNPTAPLLIWLSGGPAESSMVALLLENGPIQVEKTNRAYTYKRRNNTWANNFSMLYIDNPVGAGYSYTENIPEGYRSSQDGYSSYLYEFIKQFYQMFPEYLPRDLYIGGDQYAVEYVSALAYLIHQEKLFCESEIPLRGIYLADPLIDSIVHEVQVFDLYYNLGYISHKQLIEFKKNMMEQLPLLELPLPESAYRLWFRYSYENFHTVRVFYTQINGIFNVMASSRLASLLHVGNASFFVLNHQAYEILLQYAMVTTVTKTQLTELMDYYKVLMYAGDLNGLSSAPGLETIIQSLRWSYQSEYDSSVRVAWKGKNGIPIGFYNHVSDFCRVVIRLAGGRTGQDQPDNTLEMMRQFVTKGCVS